MLFPLLTGHLTGCSIVFANIRIISAFFRIEQKNCAVLAIKQLLYNPKSKNSREIGHFEEVFSPETATKTRQFVCDEFLTSRPLTEEPGN